MSLQTSEKMVTLRNLHKDRDLYDMDWEVQRDLAWNDERKSLLIHSFLYGYYVPNLIVMDNAEDETMLVMDGKQRMTTIFSFLDEGFALHKDTPPIHGIEIAGCHFSTLPEELREDLLAATITIVEYKPMEEKERDDFFFRLNNGVQLTRTQKIKSVAGSTILRFLKEIKNTHFFEESTGVAKSSKDNVIMQIATLAINDFNPVAFSGDFLEDTFESIDTIPENVQDIMIKTTEYLGEAFPVQDKTLLKKVDVPIVFAMAVKAQEMNIEPRKFSGWFQDFMKRQKPGNAYMDLRRHGSAKKENVQKRLAYADKDFEKNIQDAPGYVIPEVKQSQGRRGRPSKNKSEITEQTNEEQSA
jgi:hypothetical protein